MSDDLDVQAEASPAIYRVGIVDETMVSLAPIVCINCQAPIPAGSTLARSPDRRVLSVACPWCASLVPLATTVWRCRSARPGRPRA